jgi:hypothetical protein
MNFINTISGIDLYSKAKFGNCSITVWILYAFACERINLHFHAWN